MRLFKLNKTTYEVEFEEVALTLQPFRALWSRDRSKDKNKSKAELAYIYFMSDVRSDYQYITDVGERAEEVIKDLKLKDTILTDKKVNQAMDFYKERSKTISGTLLEDSYLGVSKISSYLRDVNLDDTVTTKSGEIKPKHDVKKIADTIKLIPSLLSALQDAEKAHMKEQDDATGKKKGSKSFNMFEDGL